MLSFFRQANPLVLLARALGTPGIALCRKDSANNPPHDFECLLPHSDKSRGKDNLGQGDLFIEKLFDLRRSRRGRHGRRESRIEDVLFMRLMARGPFFPCAIT